MNTPNVTAEPILPTYGITRAEYLRRVAAAENIVEEKRERHGHPNGKYGHETMWHYDFEAGCVASFSDMALCNIEAFLTGNLAGAFNRTQPLDRADYLYLADCLREGIADNPTPIAALRLARALTWVEQVGVALSIQQQVEGRE